MNQLDLPPQTDYKLELEKRKAMLATLPNHHQTTGNDFPGELNWRGNVTDHKYVAHALEE